MSVEVFACKDCRFYDKTTRTMSTCDWDDKCHDGTDELCPYFQAKDGKQPRFCKMAGSVDVMAEKILLVGHDEAGREVWLLQNTLYYDKDKAIEAAKKWLMEVE